MPGQLRQKTNLGNWAQQLSAPYTAQFLGWVEYSDPARARALLTQIDEALEHQMMCEFMEVLRERANQVNLRDRVLSAPTLFENLRKTRPTLAALVEKGGPQLIKALGSTLSAKGPPLSPLDDSADAKPNIPGQHMLPVDQAAPYVIPTLVKGLRMGARLVGKLFATHHNKNAHLVFVSRDCYYLWLCYRSSVISTSGVDIPLSLMNDPYLTEADNGDILVCAPLP